jgi:hypothetical protein
MADTRDGLVELLYGIDGEGRDGWPRWLASLPWDIREMCRRSVEHAREQRDDLLASQQALGMAEAGIAELHGRIEARDAEIAMLRSTVRERDARLAEIAEEATRSVSSHDLA